jgi:hypothetical protein
MAVQAFGGFGEDFDEALADDRELGGNGGGNLYQDRIPELGDVVRFGKSGSLEAKTTNKKNQEVAVKTSQLVGILVDSSFSKQDWGIFGSKDGLKCATTSYTLTTKAGPQKKETGWWKLPYYGDSAVKRYDPVGSKKHPETGAPIKCSECVELGLNKTCGDKGNLYFVVFGYHDAAEDEIVMVKTPYIITIQTPKTSGISFQKYVRDTLPSLGFKVNSVLTRLSLVTETFTSGGSEYPTNLLSFAADGELTDEQRGTAQRLYADSTEAWKKSQEEAKKKRQAEKQAKSGNSGGGKKSAAGSDDPPFSLDSDEVDY